MTELSTEATIELMLIRDQLVARRRALGWSQDRLADEMGTGQAVISRLENDVYPDTRLSTYYRWAEALGGKFQPSVLLDELLPVQKQKRKRGQRKAEEQSAVDGSPRNELGLVPPATEWDGTGHDLLAALGGRSQASPAPGDSTHDPDAPEGTCAKTAP